ncbi:MAG: hypothetical protein GF331_22075, partial [Chitinivibrionales bacterium]|nr:hypothetical protein [Chitinivibrionales bacterium]
MVRCILVGAMVMGLAASTAGQEDFRLESELKTTYADAGTNEVFTYYTYDAGGKRIEKTAYDGPDAQAGELSTTLY